MNKGIWLLAAAFVACLCLMIHLDSQTAQTPADHPTQSVEQGTALTDPENPIQFLFAPIMDKEPANQELQTYVTDQHEISDHTFRMVAEQTENGYRSAKLESTVALRYGEFVFRIKPMKGTGLFPAIWMMPASGDSYPEVDIYEMLGNQPELFYGVLHYLDHSGETARQFYTYHFEPDQVPEQMELRFVWTPQKIEWYLEDKLIYTITKDVPSQPMYMIMNLAVGGEWPGNPDESTQFPATFEVEIVKFEPKEIFNR